MKKQNILYSIFEAGFLTVLCLIILISLTGTQYHIAWYKEGFVTAVWLVCLMVLFCALKKWEKLLEKHERVLLPAFCILWGMGLYAFSCLVRNVPSHDYHMVWNAVMDYIEGREVTWWYFAIWKNNYFLFIILSGLAKLSGLLGFQDPFYLILLFSVLLTCGGVDVFINCCPMRIRVLHFLGPG
ncbi:MAG: hypothetical protein NC126_10945 [Clostridium sp.]|nr:hypothetical protein [Clostridium sp.]